MTLDFWLIIFWLGVAALALYLVIETTKLVQSSVTTGKLFVKKEPTLPDDETAEERELRLLKELDLVKWAGRPEWALDLASGLRTVNYGLVEDWVKVVLTVAYREHNNRVSAKHLLYPYFQQASGYERFPVKWRSLHKLEWLVRRLVTLGLVKRRPDTEKKAAASLTEIGLDVIGKGETRSQ